MNSSQGLSHLFLPIILLSGFSLLAQSSNVLSPYIVTREPYELFTYPIDSSRSHSFAVIDPGLVLKPYKNGIFTAGWNAWLWKQTEPAKIAAIYPCPTDQKMYFIRLQNRKTELFQYYNENKTPNLTKMTEWNLSLENMKGISDKAIYFWGKDNTDYKIWQFNGKLQREIFHSKSAIKDLTIVNESTVLVILGENELVLVKDNGESKSVMKLDMPLHSIVLAADGSFFLGSDFGTHRFYSFSDPKDMEPITYYLHGQMQIFKDYLYIDLEPYKQVLKIKL